MTQREGIVTKGVGGLYTVAFGDISVECRARGRFRKEETVLSVGDRVRVSPDNAITEILPRKNCLIRPAVANLDKLLIVTALAQPDPDRFYLDKLTVIAEYYGIEPVLIFNKSDLGDPSEILPDYERLPYKKFILCTRRPQTEQISLLAKELEGKTSAFAGASGVGKSSILNLLAEFSGAGLSAETGDISRKLRRGKHTTRHVELFSLCGGYLADTPGFGSFEFSYFDLKDRSRLASCFPEFSDSLDLCRFADCSHVKEKDCAVKAAVASGRISSSRYGSYCRMYEELGEYRPWELE